MKSQVWVLVANSSTARIFNASNGETTGLSLKELEAFEHPESRVHSRDLVTSKAGRTFDSMGAGRHGMEPELTPQKNEAHHFAEKLGSHLEHSRRNGAFSKLYLVASPAFLGMLRSVLHAHTRDMIALEVDKDITSKSAEEIRSYLPFRL